MVLGWFARARDENIDELVRRKKYAKAIKLIRAELEKRRTDRRLRTKLADVLVLAGHRKEGLGLLNRLADELALAGRVGQAIAVLKKIEAVEPGREDVEEKMAHLVELRGRPSFDPWSGRGKAPADSALEVGFEPSLRDDGAAPPAEPAAPEPAAPVPAAEDEEVLSDEAVRDELVALIEDTLNPEAAPPAEAVAAMSSAVAPPADEGIIDTPLFRHFSKDELVALIRGLRLLTFEPGEIVVAEGEPGASLFLITSGSVRAYVRNAASRQIEVRRLGEGDFFGEISVLTGQPRSATVTASARCELLELEKPTLDRIASSHPHVRNVLQEFYDQRADNTLETLIRGMGLAR
jgi:hypothetical protein